MVLRLGALAVAFGGLSGCAPARQAALDPPAPEGAPAFHPDEGVFVSFDGARLGLTVWPSRTGAPEIVVVGLHGMNDYANAFHMAAPSWAERGVTGCAYAQRGHGRSRRRGIWAEQALLRRDLRTAVEVARSRHPDAVLAVVGISMGGAVAMTEFARADAPQIDRLILSAPALRGWEALPWIQRVALRLSAHVRPGWRVVPPRRFIRIEPSDNIEMLRRLVADPLRLDGNRIDMVLGVVELMSAARFAAADLRPPTLAAYGQKDIVIPASAMREAAPRFPDHVRTVYYSEGYHMLLRDLQAETVWADYLAFLRDADATLPSGAPSWPWRRGEAPDG